jgi:hypothetical protein
MQQLLEAQRAKIAQDKITVIHDMIRGFNFNQGEAQYLINLVKSRARAEHQAEVQRERSIFGRTLQSLARLRRNDA